MSQAAKQTILTAVRRALDELPLAQSPEPLPRLDEPEDDAWSRLEQNLAPVGGNFTLARDQADLERILTDLAHELNLGRVAIWDHPDLERCNAAEILTRAGAEVIRPQDCGQEAVSEAADCVAGVTAVDWAMLATGALVVSAGPRTLRSVSIAPPVHLALVGRDRLVGGISKVAQWLEELRTGQDGLPSAVNTIAGPSKTADIELILTMGVHGPGRVEVIGLDF